MEVYGYRIVEGFEGGYKLRISGGGRWWQALAWRLKAPFLHLNLRDYVGCCVVCLEGEGHG